MKYRELLNNKDFYYTVDSNGYNVMVELYYKIHSHKFPIAWAFKKEVNHFLDEKVNDEVLKLIKDVEDVMTTNNTSSIIVSLKELQEMNINEDDSTIHLEPIRGQRTNCVIGYEVLKIGE